MQNEGTGFLTGLFSARTNLLNIVFVAVLASLGINLVATGLLDYSLFNPTTTIQIGIFFCIIPIAYFLGLVLRHRRKESNFEGFVMITKDKKVPEIFRYDYAEKLSTNLYGAFAEDNELKELWDMANDKIQKSTASFQTFRDQLQPIIKIISEASEYYVLDRLSLHLSSFFNNDTFQKENLNEIGRKDIPQVLLANRFLELFSRPMNE